MAIYLHPIDEQPSNVNQDKWVEIDLVSWRSSESDYPVGLTLLRRLDTGIKAPYLQELMFEGLHKGRPIKQLMLEIPTGPRDEDVELHQLSDVKVVNYQIHPQHPKNKQSYEKIVLVAKSQKTE